MVCLLLKSPVPDYLALIVPLVPNCHAVKRLTFLVPFYSISSNMSHVWRVPFTETVSWGGSGHLQRWEQPLRSHSVQHTFSFADLVLPFLQLRDLEMSHHYEDRSSESTFRDSRSHSQDNSEPPDLPMPTCFRSRSHSYLRAIQAGCSQDDDTASIDSGCSPPLTDSTVRTYSTSTGESRAKKQMINLLQINLFDHIKKHKVGK